MADRLRSTAARRRLTTAVHEHIAGLDRRIAAVGTGHDERGFGPIRQLWPLVAARSALEAQFANLQCEQWGGGEPRPDPLLAEVYEDLARLARGELG